MKKLILFAGLWCVLQLGAMSEYLKVYSPDAQFSGIAQEAVSELAKENYAALFNRFDDSMKSAMPAARLPEIWESINEQIGELRSQRTLRQEKTGSHDVVFVSCQFTRASLDIELVFNDKGEISGLFFGPSAVLTPDSPATRPANQAVKEELAGVWQGSLYAGAFISRFFTVPGQPSGFMGPLQLYDLLQEWIHFKMQS
jgi:hypothetical protein